MNSASGRLSSFDLSNSCPNKENAINREPLKAVDYYGRILLPVENVPAVVNRGVRLCGLYRTSAAVGYIGALASIPAAIFADANIIPKALRKSFYLRDAFTQLLFDADVRKSTNFELLANALFCEWEILTRSDSRDARNTRSSDIDHYSYRAPTDLGERVELYADLAQRIRSEMNRRRLEHGDMQELL